MEAYQLIYKTPERRNSPLETRHSHLSQRRIGTTLDRCIARRTKRGITGKKILDMQEHHEWSVTHAADRLGENLQQISDLNHAGAYL